MVCMVTAVELADQTPFPTSTPATQKSKRVPAGRGKILVEVEAVVTRTSVVLS